MSKIGNLVKQLCPDGVEYVELGNIVNILNGYSFKSGKYVRNGIRVIRISDVQKGCISDKDVKFYPLESQDKIRNYMLRENDLVMSLTGNVGRVAMVLKSHLPAGLNQRVACIRPKSNVIETRYLFHYFDQDIFESVAMANATGGGQKNMSTTWLSHYTIPIPPLPVQEEIVRILDTFTKLVSELVSELEAELEARKAQYSYYRNRLLTPIEINGKWLLNGKEVEWRTLGEIAIFISKGTTPKAYSHTGISFIKTEAFDGPFINKSKLSYIDEITHLTVLKRSILEVNDILFTIAGATIGKCIIVDSDILPANTNQALAIIRLSNQVNNRYVFYMLRSERMVAYINQSIKGSAQPNLNLQQLNSFILPIPPLEEQERIVAILDKFDALVNDISVGIPAEIAARRKQYEYYREKLLHFEVLG